MPLWDLSTSCAALVPGSAERGQARRLASFARNFLSLPFNALLQRQRNGNCRSVGLGRDLVKPLFYTCWMHRALKESTRLRREFLHQGHYFNLLALVFGASVSGISTPVCAVGEWSRARG